LLIAAGSLLKAEAPAKASGRKKATPKKEPWDRERLVRSIGLLRFKPGGLPNRKEEGAKE
jgi:hypothetical protein